jgi:hypothetical protein
LWNWRNVLWGASLAIVLVAVLWFVPQWQGRYFSQGVPAKEVPALVNEYRRTWAQIIGGFVLLLGLYFTWRRVEISQRTLETAQDQQVTERFTRAIDQLGATDDDGKPQLEIRLGGIYALERIARDSPERDYSTVMEVLTAYVRENAPWPPKSSKSPERDFIKPPERGSVSISASNEATEPDKDSVQGVEAPTGTPRTDIQAVLDVLKRREEDRIPEKHRVRLDLRGTDLRGVNLLGASLRRADLCGADLRGADLREADLCGADLQGADLLGANLRRADLLGADLQGAYLRKADLRGADLRVADLRGARELTQEQIEWTMGLNDTALPERPNPHLVFKWTIGRSETALPEGLNRPQLWSKSIEAQTRIVRGGVRWGPQTLIKGPRWPSSWS